MSSAIVDMHGVLLDDQKPRLSQRLGKESSRLRSAVVQNPNHAGIFSRPAAAERTAII